MESMKWEVARILSNGEVSRGGIYTTDVRKAAAWAESNNKANVDENSFYVVVEANEYAISEEENERDCEEASTLKRYHFEWRETFRDYHTVEAHDEDEAWDMIENRLAWENYKPDLADDSMGDGEWVLMDVEEHI